MNKSVWKVKTKQGLKSKCVDEKLMAVSKKKKSHFLNCILIT